MTVSLLVILNQRPSALEQVLDGFFLTIQFGD